MPNKPKIGITMGDPNGIGPEVAVRAYYDQAIVKLCDIVFIGSKDVLNKANQKFGDDRNINVVDPTDFYSKDLTPSIVSKDAGNASVKCIERAVKMALSKEIDAIVTAPISKESIHLAGSKYPGHTEMLQDLTFSENAVMLFEGGKFRVALMTIHAALSEVPKLITTEKVLNTIRICNSELKKKFGILDPKIVVCGLNPHAGEAGAFGREEIEHIIPAVKKAKGEGVDVEGPLPADTLFYNALEGKWDLVIAMYHDQGLIPFKMLSFDTGVNVTIGLPIIRTSPDHGTAFDIAWKGAANPQSMIEAVKVAVKLIYTY
ncbi:MAG: 4-hydroxythreonine-4-phosphate dehydrogenase PdxA [Thermodesulfobacteriota bacterium]